MGWQFCPVILTDCNIKLLNDYHGQVVWCSICRYFSVLQKRQHYVEQFSWCYQRAVYFLSLSRSVWKLKEMCINPLVNPSFVPPAEGLSTGAPRGSWKHLLSNGCFQTKAPLSSLTTVARHFPPARPAPRFALSEETLPSHIMSNCNHFTTMAADLSQSCPSFPSTWQLNNDMTMLLHNLHSKRTICNRVLPLFLCLTLPPTFIVAHKEVHGARVAESQGYDAIRMHDIIEN